MGCCNIEIDDEAHACFERMAHHRCRSIEEEIEGLLSLLIWDPDYLDHLERTIHRGNTGEEWKDTDTEE